MKLDKKNWQTVRFGDVVYQGKGAVDPETSGLERYIAGEHMNSEDLHLRQWGTVGEGYLGPAFHRLFERGDILYGSRRTYLKKVAVADFDGITSNTTFIIKENVELVEPGLVPFLMLSDQFTEHSVKNSKGSVNPYINFKDIAKFEFRIPPRNEQTQLVELLWAADEVGEKYRDLIKELNACKAQCSRAVFEEANEFVTVQEIAKVTSGGTPSRNNDDYWGGNIPWIKTTEIDYADIKSAEEYITELGLKNSSAKYIPKGSLLMAMYGQGVTRGRVARLAIDATINQACAAIIPHEEIDSDYLYYYFQYAYDEIRNLAQGANQQNLSGGIIKEIKIPYPCSARRKSCVQQLEEIDNNIRESRFAERYNKRGLHALINQIFSS